LTDVLGGKALLVRTLFVLYWLVIVGGVLAGVLVGVLDT
jgi:hypothetical protein